MPLPPDHLDGTDRLQWYQDHRKAEEADAYERERVAEALRVPVGERTEQEAAIIAYSPFGTGGACPARGYYIGSR